MYSRLWNVLSTEYVQKSHLGTKLWAFEKKVPPKVGIFRVASFKQPLRRQVLTKSKNFKNQHVTKSLRFILGFGIFEKTHF